MESQPHHTKGNTFLVIENDPNDAFLIQRALNASASCGSSTVCRNLTEAKAYLKGTGIYADRSAYPFPDLVLTDMRMESESGLELVDWIRHEERPLKGLPVVVLTGSASPLQMEAAKEVGATKVCTKPHGLDDLKELMKGIAKEFCSKS